MARRVKRNVRFDSRHVRLKTGETEKSNGGYEYRWTSADGKRHSMQFYKFEGFTVEEKWSEKNDNRRVMREKVRKISMKTNSFNQHQQRKAYVFVADASEDTVTSGAIVRNYADVPKLISEYLQTIEMELKDTCLEEITFNTLRNMLSCADRNDYIKKALTLIG